MTQYFVVVNQWSSDFEQGTEVLAVKKNIEDAKAVYAAALAEEKKLADSKGWIVTCDTDVMYEAGEDGSWCEGHTKLYIQMIEEEE